MEKRKSSYQTFLSKVDLSEVDLQGANLSFANLNGTDLLGTDLRGSNLAGAKLRRAILLNAKMSDASIENTDFSNANLESADLSRSNLSKSNFHSAVLKNTKLIRVIIKGADLSDAKLSEADFKEAIISDCDLSKADLRWANFSGSDLRNAILYGADLRWANFKDTDITGADLTLSIRVGWKIDRIKCEYIINNQSHQNISNRSDWDLADFTNSFSYEKERIPKDYNFEPGEFERLYKEAPVIEIEFPEGLSPLDPLVLEYIAQKINAERPDLGIELITIERKGNIPKITLRHNNPENQLEIKQIITCQSHQLQDNHLELKDMIQSFFQQFRLSSYSLETGQLIASQGIAALQASVNRVEAKVDSVQQLLKEQGITQEQLQSLADQLRGNREDLKKFRNLPWHNLELIDRIDFKLDWFEDYYQQQFNKKFEPRDAKVVRAVFKAVRGILVKAGEKFVTSNLPEIK